MIVKIMPNDKGTPPGKLAEAEVHFEDGYFQGLKLVGFAVWERRSGNGRNVTFPARQYSVNGERRSFALLRPIADATAQDRLRDLILQAYREHEEQLVTESIGRVRPIAQSQSASRSPPRASAAASTPRGGSCRARCGRRFPSCRRR